ncbi:hypothetical protein LGT39_11770 [Demequina sp. TTPB684]|uniref:hypothetical protein n=1 Tax=unclassified Demequina TaxID=2620311 RepID=UPI001CF2572D|nr:MULTISPECIES: hypothetical protein [unclassified Demequina]MCB2413520.1 hypothetical protein [Demequina sp. TTPB684]UPU87160.1 hypothetical protein LGT36_007680 [Demequina sp. TMPB413]
MGKQRAMKANLTGWALVALVPLLVACDSGSVEEVVNDQVEDSVEKAIEDSATADGGQNLDLDIGGDAAVPDSFPSELPLPDGTLVASVAMDEGWQLSYQVQGISEAEALAAHFTDDGAYEQVLSSATGGIQTWVFTGPTYSVTIGFIEDGAESQMSYLVVPTEG